MFLITSFLGGQSGQLMFAAEEVDAIITAASVSLVSNLIDIPAAIVAITLVKSLTALQSEALRWWQIAQVDAPRG